LDTPPIALWHAPRGGGKSFDSGIDSHAHSRFNERYGTRILGGSLAQSEQIHEALRDVVLHGRGPMGTDRASIRRLTKRAALYHNGSNVSILAAATTSVMGPHVPSLKIDEVDEVKEDIFDKAMGMGMEIRGQKTSVLMTSTWHRVAGPMASLMELGRNGKIPFPVSTYCVFEVLERCPEERSGPNLERCPDCAIYTWCHAGRDAAPGRLPKAKRSNGHYTIDTLCQKAAIVSPRVFESNYLCLEPRAAGVWFTTWDKATHVRLTAEYDPRFDVHNAIDPGVETGAVWFQKRPNKRGTYDVNVFADYYGYDRGAETNGIRIKERSTERCEVGMHRMRISHDPAGDAKTAMGGTVRGEFERAGLRGVNGLESWGQRPKQEGLQLVEALLKSADGYVSLTIHPRCTFLIAAFSAYVRDKKNNQWLDMPKDPQHPHEDLIDPLCGGLRSEFPEGRGPEPNLRKVPQRGIY
jgi:hypothetical protein